MTFVPVARPGKNLDHRDMETLAKEVAHEFHNHCRKLRQLKPKIQLIQNYYSTAVRGSVTLAGCSSFKEYCEKKLGRTKQAVYSMLGDYPQKKEQKKKKKVLAKPITHDLNLAGEDQMRLVTAANAVIRARDAEARGDKAEAASAWAEHEKITKAEPLKSRLAGDQPNYKVMLIDLLDATERLDLVLRNIMDAGMLAGDKVILTKVKSRIGTVEKLCQAYRSRLGITDANISGGVN
ncbi:MAG TPA: hypothetical protein VNX60_05035 [Candidatus Acidoferrum sp.]|nr:hypothetical protein [Candidatus Acidoferrum sp.]